MQTGRRSFLSALALLAQGCRAEPPASSAEVPEERRMRVSVTYVFDAYCGWCYGFSATFRDFVARHAGEIDLTVIPGGLFVGELRVPMRELGYVARANASIAALTGATFGPAYAALVHDGSFVMDSREAARGFLALSDLIAGRDAELAAAMQSAFYVDGQSLSAPETYAARVSAPQPPTCRLPSPAPTTPPSHASSIAPGPWA
jgi:2-hydroxychromene-2-carboxylate isomerase